jgi:hypothetical protein
MLSWAPGAREASPFAGGSTDRLGVERLRPT